MTTHYLEERVDAAFTHAEMKAYTNDYLAIIRENWRQAETDERRTTLALIAVIILFELAARTVITIKTWLGGEITNSTLILPALPTIAAFYYYQFMYLSVVRYRLERVHGRIMRHLCRPLSDSGLDLLMHPHFLPTFFEPRFSTAANTAKRPTMIVIRGIVVLVSIGGPFVFVGDAYWRVWALRGTTTPFFGIIFAFSLCFALVFIVKGLHCILVSTKEL